MQLEKSVKKTRLTCVTAHSWTSLSKTGSGPTIRTHLWLQTSFIENRRAGLTSSMFLIKFSQSANKMAIKFDFKTHLHTGKAKSNQNYAA